MKLHWPTKIIFIILLAMLIAALIFLTVEYPKLKLQPVKQPTTEGLNQPAGTCAPDLSDCKGNAQLCMTENKQAVCE